MGTALRLAALAVFATLLTAMNVSAQTQCVETDISARMSRIEDRMSRVEDRLYSVLLAHPSGGRPNETCALEELVDRLAEVTDALENMKAPNDTAQDADNEPEPDNTVQACEKGMAATSSESYLVMDHPNLNKQIRCDTQTDGGGWVVFQRRAVGDVDFYRTWNEYRDGFGSLDGDFWLGNEALYTLTNAHDYQLRVDVRFDDQDYFAQFSTIRLEDENQKFKLLLGTYSGNVGDSGGSGFAFNNNGPFSTFDSDNDSYSNLNCAVTYHGAWWYKQCSAVNLNGEWGTYNPKGLRWYNGQVHRYATFTEMKIRRV